MSAVPILDLDIIEEAKSVMKARFMTMVEYFLEDAETYSSGIREGLEQNNSEKIRAAAHTLKSSSKQLGALRLSETAKEMEYTVQGEGSGTESLDQQFHKLEQIMVETKAAFQDLVK